MRFASDVRHIPDCTLKIIPESGHSLQKDCPQKLAGLITDFIEKLKEKEVGRGCGVPGSIFEPGKPEGKNEGKWRQKLQTREEKLKYLRTGERYWRGEEGYGSEKRRNPA